MADNSEMKTVELNTELIQMIVIDAINIFTRDVLKAKNLVNEDFNTFFEEDFDEFKYNIAKSISDRYKGIQITT